jgi:hypothetical protein
LLEDLNQIEQATATYDEALEIMAIRKSRVFWLSYSDFELRQNNVTRARTLLQKARVKIVNEQDSQRIWYESIYLEIKQNNIKIAQALAS